MTDAQKGLRDVFRNLLQGIGNAVDVSDPRYYLREGRQAPAGAPEKPDASQAAQTAALAKVAKYKAEFDKRVTDISGDFATAKLTSSQFREDMLREIRFLSGDGGSSRSRRHR